MTYSGNQTSGSSAGRSASPGRGASDAGGSTKRLRPEPEVSEAGLHSGLSRRQISLIAIGGVIGAGFFVGSRVAVAEAGPAILLSYLIAGTIVVLVMRMLGEMAVAHPDTGSFSVYADRSIGRWAGFTIGWLYTWFWLLALAVEAVAGAVIAHEWWPALDTWAWTLIIIAVLTITNLISVKFYGEFEFWFASTKVLAIIAFIVLAGIAVFGWWPELPAPGSHNLLGEGGFFPNGFAPVLGVLPVLIFSLFGVEIATIAAGESDDPVRAVTAAVRSVIGRILVFYVLGMALILTLVAWNDPSIQGGPFLAAVQVLNIPEASLIVNIIVFVAVLSCLNSAMYTASRMMYSLALRGDAPKVFGRTSRGGVPWVTILVCVGAGVLTALANVVWEDSEVFKLVLSSSGGVGLFVWLVIAFSQWGTRREAQRRGQKLTLRMWGYPWLTIAVIVVLVALAVLCIILEDQRTAMLSSAGLAVVLAFAGILRRGLSKQPYPEDVVPVAVAPGTAAAVAAGSGLSAPVPSATETTASGSATPASAATASVTESVASETTASGSATPASAATESAATETTARGHTTQGNSASGTATESAPGRGSTPGTHSGRHGAGLPRDS